MLFVVCWFFVCFLIGLYVVCCLLVVCCFFVCCLVVLFVRFFIEMLVRHPRQATYRLLDAHQRCDCRVRPNDVISLLLLLLLCVVYRHCCCLLFAVSCFCFVVVVVAVAVVIAALYRSFCFSFC